MKRSTFDVPGNSRKWDILEQFFDIEWHVYISCSKFQKRVDISAVPRSRRSLDISKIVGSKPDSKPKVDVRLNRSLDISISSSISAISVAPAAEEVSDDEDENYSFSIDKAAQGPFRHVTSKYREIRKWSQTSVLKTDSPSLCNKLLEAYKKMDFPPMRQKPVNLELMAISVKRDFNWTIIRTQLIDVLINFCSQVVHPGQSFHLQCTEAEFTGRKRLVFQSEHEIRFENSKSPVSADFSAPDFSNFIVTVQLISKIIIDSCHRFLVTDSKQNFSVMKVPIEHHDLSRLLAFGAGQKIIVCGVRVEASSVDLSPQFDSIIRKRNFFKMDFKPFSRVKLPLDNHEKSLLNILPGRISLADAKSEDLLHFTSSRIIPNSRVSFTTTISGGSSEGFHVQLNGRRYTIKAENSIHLEAKSTYKVNCAFLSLSSVIHIDEWSDIQIC